MKTGNQKSGSKIGIYIIFAILMTIIALIISAAVTVRCAVTKDNVIKCVENTDYLTIKIADPNGYEVTLNEMLYSTFNAEKADRSSICRIIEETGVEGIASDYIYSYISYVLFDSNLNELTAQNVISLYNKKLPIIEQNLGVQFSQEEIQAVEELINSQEELFYQLSEDGINDLLGSYLGIIRFVFSNIGIIVLAVSGIGLLVLCCCVSKNVYIPLRIMGIILLSVSIPSIVILFLIISGNFIIDVGTLTAASIVFRSVGGIFVPPCLKVMEYILSVGAIMVLLSAIIKNVVKSRSELLAAE